MLHVAPHVEPVRDVLLAQYFAELQVPVQAYIPVRRTEYDLHVPQVPVVGVGHEVDWVVEVYVVVVVTVHERLDVEGTAEAEQVAHHIGMTEGEVARAEPPETDAAAGDPVGTGVVTDLGDPLFGQKAIVLDVAQYAVFGVNVGIPAGIIDAVRAEDLHESPLDEPAQRLYHPPVFGFVIAAECSGEDHQRISPRSENEDLDVVAEVMTVEIDERLVHKLLW